VQKKAATAEERALLSGVEHEVFSAHGFAVNWHIESTIVSRENNRKNILITLE
jgi:hypothetical protein